MQLTDIVTHITGDVFVAMSRVISIHDRLSAGFRRERILGRVTNGSCGVRIRSATIAENFEPTVVTVVALMQLFQTDYNKLLND
jgi:hypothetical protein